MWVILLTVCSHPAHPVDKAKGVRFRATLSISDDKLFTEDVEDEVFDAIWEAVYALYPEDTAEYAEVSDDLRVVGQARCIAGGR